MIPAFELALGWWQQRRRNETPVTLAAVWRQFWQQGTRLLKRRASLTLFLTVFAQVVALGTTVFLARLMEVDSYGQYLYGLSWVLLFSQIGILGFDRLAVREVAANLTRRDFATLHGFIRFVFKWEMLIIVAAVALVYGGARLLEQVAGLAVPPFFGWALLAVPPIVLLSLQLGVVRGADRVVASQVPEKLLRPAGFLVLVGLSYLLFGRPSVPVVFAAYTGSVLLASLWAWRDLRRFIPQRSIDTGLVSRPRDWMMSSLHLSTAVLMFTINARADSLLLGLLTGARDVAIYFVALRISQATALGLGVFSSLLGPNISSRHAVNDQAGLQKLARKYAWAILALNLATALPVVVFHRPLVHLFGANFSAAAAPLLILCFGQFISSIAGPAGSFLVFCGREARNAKILGATCASNIALNLILIPRWGATGAALAASTSLVLKSLWMVWYCWKDLQINSTPLQSRWLPSLTPALPPSGDQLSSSLENNHES